MSVKLIIADGDDIGPQFNILEFGDGTSIGIDFGLGVGRRGPSVPYTPELKRLIQYLVVTHAHLDHIGSLPLLADMVGGRFFEPNFTIYGTKATRDLARLMLIDSSNINRKRGNLGLAYSREAIAEVLEDRYVPMRFRDTVDLSPQVTMSLYRAGHILGAGMPFFATSNGFRILHTGNFSTADQRLIAVAEFDQSGIDVMVLDSTYGGRTHQSRMLSRLRIAELINRATARHGKVVFGVFALGRLQEVIQIILDLKKAELIPNIPVYADGGLAWGVTDIYFSHFSELRWQNITDNPFAPGMMEKGLKEKMFEGVTFIGEEERERLANDSESCVVAATSGMFDFGPSRGHLRNMADSPLNIVCATGYQAEESTGDLLLSTERGSVLSLRTPDGGREQITVNCEAERVNLSAHSDQPELCGFVTRVKPKHVVLTHGSESAKFRLAQALAQLGSWKIHIPVKGEEIEFD